MKRILIIAILALFATASFAQTTQKQALKKVYDEEINPLEQIDKAVAKAVVPKVRRFHNKISRYQQDYR